MEQHMIEEATCSVCLELFTDPVLLECSHNFCMHCVVLLQSNDRITCPLCQAVTHVRDSPLKGNLALKNISALLKNFGKSPAEIKRVALAAVEGREGMMKEKFINENFKKAKPVPSLIDLCLESALVHLKVVRSFQGTQAPDEILQKFLSIAGKKYGTCIPGKVIRAVLGPQLRSLNFEYQRYIGDGILRQIAVQCGDLERLNLNGHPTLTDHNMEFIVRKCHQLNSISLAKCPYITASGLEIIAGLCPTLEELDVSRNTCITMKCLETVVTNAPSLKKIKVTFGESITTSLIAASAVLSPILIEGADSFGNIERAQVGRHGEEYSIEEGVRSFDDMDLCIPLLRGIYAYGLENPSKVQQDFIPALIKSHGERDTIIQAHPGSGKTLAYVIPLLQRYGSSKGALQAVVLVPTRELAIQASSVFTQVADFMDTAIICLVESDIKALRKGPSIVVATPGRILDLMRKHPSFTLEDVQTVVVDEADEIMLAQTDLLHSVIQSLKPTVEIVLCGTTYPRNAMQIAAKFMRHPNKLPYPHLNDLFLDSVRSYSVNTEREEWKLETLKDMLSEIKQTQCIVFVGMKKRARWLHEQLMDINGVQCLDSESTAEERDKIMRDMRGGNIRVLISTNHLARGIDIQSLGLVINYDLPTTEELFLHRMSRCGRFGRRGTSISLFTKAEAEHLRQLDALHQIAELPCNFADLL